jgi:hypothetical protein
MIRGVARMMHAAIKLLFQLGGLALYDRLSSPEPRGHNEAARIQSLVGGVAMWPLTTE